MGKNMSSIISNKKPPPIFRQRR